MSTIHVPADQSTISAAITAASSGDTIIVAAGVYEEFIIIDKSLTLLGAQAGVDARTRTYVPANESIITFSLPTPPAFGTGIVNPQAPNITFNGFTVQGYSSTAVINSTSAIFTGDPGKFLPNTTTIDVTGLQITNNIIQNNANGITIASIEPSPKATNYLVQYNYFYNNFGDFDSGDGQGAFFNNSAGTQMSNVLVDSNLFNGRETSSSVNLTNVAGGIITNNVCNQDNSISIFGTSGALIDHNVTYQATGIIPGVYDLNIATAIYVSDNGATPTTNATISNNLIYNATNGGIEISGATSTLSITNNCIVSNTNIGIYIEARGATSTGISITDNNVRLNTQGIVLADGVSEVTISGNNIVGNTEAGVQFTGTTNFTTTLNSNNIQLNTPGLLLDLASYQIAPSPATLLNATLNYWGSASGPNYNSGGPGTGDAITDGNIILPPTVSVLYEPFAITAFDPIACPSPVNLTKETESIDVEPGDTVSFTITFVVAGGTVNFTTTAFSDTLPALPSGAAWSIYSQSPADTFVLSGAVGSQTLTLISGVPTTLSPGTYIVELMATTNNPTDAGASLPNEINMSLLIGGSNGLTQNLSSTATASVEAIPCIAAHTLILMANGTQKPIQDIKRGDLVAANPSLSKIHQVSRLNYSSYSDNFEMDLCQFDHDSISTNIPSQPLLITQLHPILYKSTRRASKYFGELSGVQIYNKIKVNEILPKINDKCTVFDLQFDTIGSYVANGVTIQSRHPQSYLTPLPRELYFNKSLYSSTLKNDLDDSYEYPLVFDKVRSS